MEKLSVSNGIRKVASIAALSGFILTGVGCAAEGSSSERPNVTTTVTTATRFCLEGSMGIRQLVGDDTCPSSPLNSDSWTVYQRQGNFCEGTGPKDITMEELSPGETCPPIVGAP